MSTFLKQSYQNKSNWKVSFAFQINCLKIEYIQNVPFGQPSNGYTFWGALPKLLTRLVYPVCMFLGYTRLRTWGWEGAYRYVSKIFDPGDQPLTVPILPPLRCCDVYGNHFIITINYCEVCHNCIQSSLNGFKNGQFKPFCFWVRVTKASCLSPNFGSVWLPADPNIGVAPVRVVVIILILVLVVDEYFLTSTSMSTPTL